MGSIQNIAIFCITYNSYNELYAYLRSMDEAASLVKNMCQVTVFVTDNTEKNPQNIEFECKAICLKLFQVHKNLGYFGGAKYAMDRVDLSVFQYVAISNVDLTFDKQAFVDLLKLEVSENVGWLATQLCSLDEGRDRNPSVFHRYSKSKLQMLRFMFGVPVLMWLYRNTFYKRKAIRRELPPMDIYAGHGSFILLTAEYFKRCGKVDYPVFLYGEELYIAEKCSQHSLVVRYEPSVCLYDKEHCSTGKMKKSFYYECNYKALSYILKTFY